ncbi:hypothetical protein WJX77_003014 [Trebouxia sp. C0004]
MDVCQHSDLRVACATTYKEEGYEHNRKQEQLVASAITASQHIPESSVALVADPGQPALVVGQRSATTQCEVHISGTAQTCTCPQGQLHYPRKHVMKVISMTTGKTGPEIIKALGTWAGTALGGFEQLQSEADSMEQLKDGFMLADDDPAELNSTSDTADMVSAAADSNSSDAPAVTKEPGVNVAMSDNKLDQLYQKLKSITAAAPELRHHLVNRLHVAARIVERLQSTSVCGLAHPAAATSTQRHNVLNNSLVRLVSFVENPVGKRGKAAQAASGKAAAVDAPAPFAKPQPKSKKRTFTQQLADKAGDKENTSASGNTQPVQMIAAAAAAEAAAKPAPAKRQTRAARCVECKACINRAIGKQGCERNKA